MIGEVKNSALLEGLQISFNCEVETDKRAAAETAYALAFCYRNVDVGGRRRFDLAKIWAIRAIEILESLPSSTLGQVASTRVSVGGVALPDLFHSDIVRQRLVDVLI